MSTSDSGTTGIVSRPSGLSRYDLPLAVIPAAFLTALLAGEALGVPVRTSLPAGAAVGALALVDALFLNPPGTDDGRR